MDTFIDFIEKNIAILISILALIFSGFSILISFRRFKVQKEYYKRDTLPNIDIISKFEKADWSGITIKSNFSNFGNSTVKLLDLNLTYWLGIKKMDDKTMQHPNLPKTIAPGRSLNLFFTIPKDYLEKRPKIDFESIHEIFHCELCVEYCSLENEEYIKRKSFFVDE